MKRKSTINLTASASASPLVSAYPTARTVGPYSGTGANGSPVSPIDLSDEALDPFHLTDEGIQRDFATATAGEEVAMEVMLKVFELSCDAMVNRHLERLARPYAVQSITHELLDAIRATFVGLDNGAIRPAGWAINEREDEPKRTAVDSGSRGLVESRAPPPPPAWMANSQLGGGLVRGMSPTERSRKKKAQGPSPSGVKGSEAGKRNLSRTEESVARKVSLQREGEDSHHGGANSMTSNPDTSRGMHLEGESAVTTARGRDVTAPPSPKAGRQADSHHQSLSNSRINANSSSTAQQASTSSNVNKRRSMAPDNSSVLRAPDQAVDSVEAEFLRSVHEVKSRQAQLQQTRDRISLQLTQAQAGRSDFVIDGITGQVLKVQKPTFGNPKPKNMSQQQQQEEPEEQPVDGAGRRSYQRGSESPTKGGPTALAGQQQQPNSFSVPQPANTSKGSAGGVMFNVGAKAKDDPNSASDDMTALSGTVDRLQRKGLAQQTPIAKKAYVPRQVTGDPNADYVKVEAPDGSNKMRIKVSATAGVTTDGDSGQSAANWASPQGKPTRSEFVRMKDSDKNYQQPQSSNSIKKGGLDGSTSDVEDWAEGEGSQRPSAIMTPRGKASQQQATQQLLPNQRPSAIQQTLSEAKAMAGDSNSSPLIGGILKSMGGANIRAPHRVPALGSPAAARGHPLSASSQQHAHSHNAGHHSVPEGTRLSSSAGPATQRGA